MLELVILIALASWRIASLLYSEDGPFKVFRRLRAKLGIIHDEDGFPAAYPENLLGKTFECFWCLSLWVSLFVTLAITFATEVKMPGVLWLGGGAGAIMIEHWMFRSRGRS